MQTQATEWIGGAVPDRLLARLLARTAIGALGLAAVTAVLAWAAGSPATLMATELGALHHHEVAFDALLLTTVGLATWGCLGWFATLVVLEIASLAPGIGGHLCAGLAARVGPRVLRASARWLAGVALVTGPLISGPAMAAGSGHPQPNLDRPVAATATVTPADPAEGPATEVATPSAVTGYPTGAALDLDRPVSTYLPPVPSAPVKIATPDGLALLAGTPRHDIDDDGYVVRRGDALWDVAARHLGPTATAADIAREWPRWYAANRAVIGADPSLLRPGEVLYAPVN